MGRTWLRRAIVCAVAVCCVLGCCWSLTGKGYRVVRRVQASGEVGTAVVSRDGQRLAFTSIVKEPTGSKEQTVRVEVWSIRTGKRLSASVVGGFGYPIAFSPDSKTLAVMESSRITLMDAGTLAVKRRIDGVSWSTLAFSPDGKTIDGEVDKADVYFHALYDVRSGRRTRKFTGYVPGTDEGSFSNDGRLLAVIGMSEDYTRLIVWDVRSGRQLLSAKEDVYDDFPRYRLGTPIVFLRGYGSSFVCGDGVFTLRGSGTRYRLFRKPSLHDRRNIGTVGDKGQILTVVLPSAETGWSAWVEQWDVTGSKMTRKWTGFPRNSWIGETVPGRRIVPVVTAESQVMVVELR